MLSESENDRINKKEFLQDLGMNPKRTGRNLMFCCPFHGERNPSCGMNEDTGLWGCLACGEKGNIITFMAKLEGIEHEVAEKKIREKYLLKRVELSTLEQIVYDILNKRSEDPKPENTPLPEYIIYQFEKNYDYMYSRGFTKETLDYFNVVYDSNSQYQGFPVYNEDGRLVGISGRNTLNEEPRYKALVRYQKADVVFNLHNVDKKQPVILVEGEINCMAMYQHGFHNTAALLGAGIAHRQLEILKNSGIEKIIIFFDSDEAGNKGTIKLIQNLWRYMDILVVEDHKGDPAEMNSETVVQLVNEAKHYTLIQ